MNDTWDDHKKAFDRVLRQGGFHEMKVQTPLEAAGLTEHQHKIIDRAVVTGAFKWPDNLALYTKQSRATADAGEPVAKDDEEARMLAAVIKNELQFLEDEYADMATGVTFGSRTLSGWRVTNCCRARGSDEPLQRHWNHGSRGKKMRPRQSQSRPRNAELG